MRIFGLLLLSLVVGCDRDKAVSEAGENTEPVTDDTSGNGGSDGSASGGDGATGTDSSSTDSSTDKDTNTGADSGAPKKGKDSGGNDSGKAKPGPDPMVPVRFVAIGDIGTGTATQQAVAGAMAQVCAAEGCSFAIGLGDNFYNCGIDDVNDPLFDTIFNDMYHPSKLPSKKWPKLDSLAFPFYMSVGNHGYWSEDEKGDCDMGEAFDHQRAQAQSDYSVANYPKDTWFYLPSLSYSVRGDATTGGVDLFALDTHRINWGRDDVGAPGVPSQWTDIPAQLAKSTAGMKVAFGHHHYLSNGRHGNAGSYDGITAGKEDDCDKYVPSNDDVARRSGICAKRFFEDEICGKVDLLLAGHDHSLQHLESVAACPDTMLVVSGSAGKTSSLQSKPPNVALYEESVPGFFWFEVCPDLGRIDRVRAYDDEATERYSWTHSDLAKIPCE